jgi:putative phosphonate metabolism protein
MSESNGSTSRYGIYFSPQPGALLHGLGSRWLGRDAISGEALDPGLTNGLSHDEWKLATQSPRRYGFHATLKPPFRLADGITFADLQAELHEFAARHDSFEAPTITVSTLGRFLALVLAEPSETLSALAADCVSNFDRFRAAATIEEREQRMRDTLSAREREHVLRWGYPYVFDTWKFHMSLTGSLPPPALPPLEQLLRDRFAAARKQPLLVDSICIFHEPAPGAAFRAVDRAFLRAL